jgi:hypothetical protein
MQFKILLSKNTYNFIRNYTCAKSSYTFIKVNAPSDIVRAYAIIY